MAATLEHYEKVVKEAITLLTTRPVQYANERTGQPTEPYVTVLMYVETMAGLQYAKYFNQADPLLDLDTQQVRPSELTASIQFIGGNARGEISAMLANLSTFDVINFLSSDGMGYLRDSGITDLTDTTGGEREQRAQTDITFSANILPDRTITPSIQRVDIHGEYHDQAGDQIISQDTTIP